MNISKRSSWLLVLSGLLLVAPFSHASSAQEIAEARDPGKNAALFYWQALAVLPEHVKGLEWEVAAREPLSRSLEDAEFLLEKSGQQFYASGALAALRMGAQQPYCDWGTETNAYAILSVSSAVQRSNSALGLLILSCRLELARGNRQQAIDDLLAAWKFSIYLADDRVGAWMAGHSYLERLVIPLTAYLAPQLGTDDQLLLLRKLQELPDYPPFSLASYGDIWLWIVNHYGESATYDEWIADLPTGPGVSAAELADALKDTEQRSAQIAEAQLMFLEAERIAQLPYEDYLSEVDRFQEKVDGSGALTRSLLQTTNAFHEDPLLLCRKRGARNMARMCGLMYFLAGSGSQKLPDELLTMHGVTGVGIEGNARRADMTISMTGETERLQLTFGPEAIPKPAEQSHLLIYDHEADPVAQIDDALARAKATNKLVLLKWGFNGCAPCYKLHRLMEADSTLAKTVGEHFVVASMDITNDEAKEIARTRYGFSLGLPHFTVLSVDGGLVASVKPMHEFTVEGLLSAELLNEFLSKLVEAQQMDRDQ